MPPFRLLRPGVTLMVILVHGAALATLAATGDAPPPKTEPPRLIAAIVADDTPATPTPQPQPPTPPQPQPQPQPVKRPNPAPRPHPAAPVVTPRAAPATAPEAAATPAAEPAAEPAPAAPAGAAPPPPPAVAPAAIRCRAPAYPPEARRRGETGTVSLSLLIDTDGTVGQARIDQSSGSETLDQAALEALSKCRFQPGTVDGRPQAAWARLRYVWKLQ